MVVKRTFEEWRADVDRVILERTGMSGDDLPDVPYRDWFDDGIPATVAASRLLFEAWVDGSKPITTKRGDTLLPDVCREIREDGDKQMNIEVFFVTAKQFENADPGSWMSNAMRDADTDDADGLEGWYWRLGYSDPFGPFGTEEAARTSAGIGEEE